MARGTVQDEEDAVVAEEEVTNDADTELPTDPHEALLERHRREIKAMKNEVTRLKKTVPKGDKKRKKDVQEQVAKLEASTFDRQEKELREFRAANSASASTVKSNPSVVEEAADKSSTSEPSSSTGEPSNVDSQQRKPTKAQKRRDKKEQQLLEIRQQAVEEASHMPNLKQQEEERLNRILAALNLTIKEVPSNGDCLFSAIDDQLRLHNNTSPGKASLRSAASQWMWNHRDDFMPFMVNDNGDAMSEDDFKAYCHTMDTTAAWGGHPEIRALASYLKCSINVFQANGAPLRIGEEYENAQPLLLSYHRHLYSLGEHYNSLRPKQSEDNQDNNIDNDNDEE